MSAGLSIQRIGTIEHLVLDAPERRNALSRQMLAALADAVLGLAPDTSAVVISGRGAGFSAGADFGELTGTSADIDYDEAVSAARDAITACPRVVVAALEGPCLGAAADLALACDLRVAAEDSYLQVPAVRLGLFYNPATLHRAMRSFPADAVRRLFLLAEAFAAPEAHAAGLVSHVVPHGEAVATALELVEAIAPAELEAMAATKGFLEACLNDQNDTRPGNDAFWQQRRRALLDSPARRAAVAASRQRHAPGAPPTQD
jgi:enoyl-CoA hydratase/carnithine racemase